MSCFIIISRMHSISIQDIKNEELEILVVF